MGESVFVVDWLLEQKLSDWVQGLGSLAAAGTAVGIALRQERLEHHRAEAARVLRRHVLAAAIVPVLQDMRTAARVRSAMLQTLARPRTSHDPPNIEELTIDLPVLFMTAIERIDVFGARIAAKVYTLVHRIDDYNRHVLAQREWDTPVRTWSENLRPRLEPIGGLLDEIIPRMEAEISGWEEEG